VGAEPSTYAFTLSASVKASGVIAYYSGIDTTTPVEVSGGSPNAASTSILAPSVSPAQVSSLLVGFYGTAYNTVTTEPGGFTNRVSTSSTGNPAAGNAALMYADKILTTSGATGTSTATGGGGENIGQVFVLNLL
jgi:hypothetical protein